MRSGQRKREETGKRKSVHLIIIPSDSSFLRNAHHYLNASLNNCAVNVLAERLILQIGVLEGIYRFTYVVAFFRMPLG